ncbi:Predicted ATP-dependent endonuclease of the OLD family, contains P-loop ATPase and TOPRIM domains [Tenacibaculum sp. MAR_2009_124]|uniref:ATP-dependent nuclease n=1 Tax=Tenacibaculum sp. MAR_2009_124 TaxID=1250059 RepID=UPI00089A4C49|nr:ATP-binding protein [Tenacibaculum sp. MAR_2009_124]SEC33465.1 Predicted ATP-dependent endonuclease of the OLD family, contains P-loop ATPase and TOPRIM domains [Tenacibaculum sp. MAR_2009_124]
MKLILQKNSLLDFPQETKYPEYFIDSLDNNFIRPNINETDQIHTAEIQINQINLLIGANNSGKSRFMRGLLKANNHLSTISNKSSYLKLYQQLERIEFKSQNIKEGGPNYEYWKNAFADLTKINISAIENFGTTRRKDFEDKIEDIKQQIPDISDSDLKNRIKSYLDLASDFLKEIEFTINNRIKKKTYIPVLRSLLKNSNLTSEQLKIVAKELTLNTDKESQTINIHTGSDIWQKLFDLTLSRKRRGIKKFESFLSKNFFESKEVEIFADNTNNGQVSIGIDGGDFLGINEIGDGIQAIINLMFPIFFSEKNELFFIEEPEQNLHPAFQRIFIETLLTNEFIIEKNLKFFFTTHSNHFLDLTLKSNKVSFFQFQKIEEGKHLIKANIKPDRETLDILGVNNSSIFLANTLIWVEGPTDRKYLSKFLKLYCKHYHKPLLKEDLDFAFLEYGGNLISHYLFKEDENFDENEVKEKINAFSISNKIYLLADNDNAIEGSKKFQRHQDLKKLSSGSNNFYYQDTGVKEIENLLPEIVLKDFLPELINKTNKRNTKNIKLKVSSSQGIGEVFEQALVASGIKNYRKFKETSPSTTLKPNYKNKLADFFSDNNYVYQDLIENNPNLEKIIVNLYHFIKPYHQKSS